MSKERYTGDPDKGFYGICDRCLRETIAYKSSQEYYAKLPETGYVTFSLPELRFGQVMYCSDCMPKVNCKEAYEAACRRHKWLMDEYFSDMRSVMEKKKANEKLLVRPSDFMC